VNGIRTLIVAGPLFGGCRGRLGTALLFGKGGGYGAEWWAWVEWAYVAICFASCLLAR